VAKIILLVDDEERLISVLEAYLTQAGYQVETALNGEQALEISRQSQPDLIVLDLMMPVMDGYDFMRLHRKEQETPIIVLTAKVDADDKVIGLELGADDYVTKPFRPRELLARIRSVLRRSGEIEPITNILQLGEITLDREAHSVQIGTAFIDLTPSEFDLLAALMAEPGKAFSRLGLLDHLQGTDYAGYERTIDVHVKNPRAKIEPDPRSPRYIKTVYGVGYRFAIE